MTRLAKLHLAGLTAATLALITVIAGSGAVIVWIGTNVHGDALVTSQVLAIVAALIACILATSGVVYTYSELARELR